MLRAFEDWIIASPLRLVGSIFVGSLTIVGVIALIGTIYFDNPQRQLCADRSMTSAEIRGRIVCVGEGRQVFLP